MQYKDHLRPDRANEWDGRGDTEQHLSIVKDDEIYEVLSQRCCGITLG
ncbi:hypothetical protein [Candidatus Methanoliparum sp. LAM-1]|nr:hypothetical protein [Candidatus Methanoliparum sp. LAM-1]